NRRMRSTLVRWCERTAGVIPPPTRFAIGGGIIYCTGSPCQSLEYRLLLPTNLRAIGEIRC
ncbi:hypothetical protein FXE32_12510, partial [Vibrio cholerae]